MPDRFVRAAEIELDDLQVGSVWPPPPSVHIPRATQMYLANSNLGRSCLLPYGLQPLRVGVEFVKCSVVLERLLAKTMPQVGIVEKARHSSHQSLQIPWRYQKAIPPILDHFRNGVDGRRDDGDPEGKRF
jgi:hypothetical protein